MQNLGTVYFKRDINQQYSHYTTMLKKTKYVYSKHYIEKEGETTKSVHIIQEYIIEKAKTNPKQIRVHIYRYIKMRQN